MKDMKFVGSTPEEYIEQLSEDRKNIVGLLRKTVLDNLPEGFIETINYGMLGYVVPHTLYPAGYHCNSKLPLPFMNIASQKNFVALYHMGLYADAELMDWFTAEYAKVSKTKLDIGKSCIRFKSSQQIPFDLIAELAKKLSVEEWTTMYEAKYKNT